MFIGHTLSFLPWIHNLDDTIGLFNGSLYDVLQDINFGTGSADISAIGFNMTCGYLPGTNTYFVDDNYWNISFESPVPPALLLPIGI